MLIIKTYTYKHVLTCIVCFQITDSGIKTLSKGNSKEKITELRIAYCPKITFGVLSSVVESFINMEVLEFHNCCESPGECNENLLLYLFYIINTKFYR